MNAQSKKNHRMTPEAYLELEKNSDIRHEYFDGEILGQVIKIESIDCEVPLSDIYQWVEFDRKSK